MLRVCRTCLRKISDFNYISLIGGIQSLQVKNELTLCVPEMVWDSVTEAVMCTSCVRALHSAYDFKRQCLHTEERIQNYMQGMPTGFRINIADICDADSDMEVTTTQVNIIADKSETHHEDSTQTIVFEHGVVNIKEEFASEDDYKVTAEYLSVAGDDYESLSGQGAIVEKAFDPLAVHERLEEKTYQCPTCKFKTVGRSTLLKHMAGHGPDNPFKCDLCNFSTARRYTWMKHIQGHSKKPYKCDHCEYTTTYKRHLSIHVTQHKSDKPYQCHLCDYRSGEKSKLRRHLLTHGSEKPFICNMCSFSTTRSDTLKKHLSCHMKKELKLNSKEKD